MSELVGKKIIFLDPRHGFWRMGTCLKQVGKVFHVKDVLDHKSRVLIDEIELYTEKKNDSG